MKVNASVYAHLIELVMADPGSCPDLAQETGLHIQTVRHYLHALHKRRLVHVADWERDVLGRDCRPVYAWGAGEDRPRGRMTDTQKQLAYRARRRARAVLHMTAGSSARV